MKRGGALKRRRGLRRTQPEHEIKPLGHYRLKPGEFFDTDHGKPEDVRAYTAVVRGKTNLYRTPLARKARLRPVTADAARRKRRFARQYDSAAYVEWIHARPCAVPRCRRGPCDAAHARSRGAGGTARHVLPLCGGPSGHHAEQHRIGVRSFEAKYRIVLLDISERTWKDWERRLLRDSL